LFVKFPVPVFTACLTSEKKVFHIIRILGGSTQEQFAKKSDYFKYFLGTSLMGTSKNLVS
jgi:hypothetical protein